MTLAYITANAVAMEDLIIRKNRVHHSEEGMAGAYRKRQESRKERRPARATLTTTVKDDGKKVSETYNTARRLNEEDFQLVREANACFKCLRVGHSKAQCTRPLAPGLDLNMRAYLLRSLDRQPSRSPSILTSSSGLSSARSTPSRHVDTSARGKAQREARRSARATGVTFTPAASEDGRIEEVTTDEEE
jgi:hypothetical protein